jgi:hypothetical protein
MKMRRTQKSWTFLCGIDIGFGVLALVVFQNEELGSFAAFL